VGSEADKASEGSGDGEDLAKLLDRLAGHIDSEKLRGRDGEKRSSERRPVKLIFEYRVSGDERAYGGRVLDVSSGGLRCTVSEDMSVGDLLAISIKSPHPGVLEGRIDAYGEVVRVRRRGRVRELGLRFVHPAGSQDVPVERRHHRRMDVEFGLSVRAGDGRQVVGEVRNLSGGGLSFLSDVGFLAGEEIAVSLGPRRSSGLEGTLSSVARVTRVRQMGEHYEIAAAFVG